MKMATLPKDVSPFVLYLEDGNSSDFSNQILNQPILKSILMG